MILLNKGFEEKSVSIELNNYTGSDSGLVWQFKGEDAEDMDPTWGSRKGKIEAMTLPPVSITIFNLFEAPISIGGTKEQKGLWDLRNFSNGLSLSIPAGNYELTLIDAMGKSVADIHSGFWEGGALLVPLPSQHNSGLFFIRDNITGHHSSMVSLIY